MDWSAGLECWNGVLEWNHWNGVKHWSGPVGHFSVINFIDRRIQGGSETLAYMDTFVNQNMHSEMG